MSDYVRCKRCDEPALPDRTLCRAHTDLQKSYQANYEKKKAGDNGTRRVKVETRAIVPAALRKEPKPPRITKVSVTRIVPGSELTAAVEQLKDELGVLERAQGILDRMARG